MDLEILGAAREVTGSCYLIRCGRHRLLVDCGLIQGSPKDEARNRDPFPFDPTRLDAVVLTHSHLDHSGRIPLLINSGFDGPIYTQRAARDLCRIMLKDAGYLNEKDAQWENRKRQRKGLKIVEPLYTMSDAQQAMHQFKVLDYDVEREILPGVRLRLRDAGHILGSAVVELWLTEDGHSRKLVFSGDLGHVGAPILHRPKTVPDADWVILESTYGDRNHRDWNATWDELADVFEQTSRSKGNILIPAFAVGRTQELLYMFGENFQAWNLDRWSIFLDSPLAIQATEVYARHWNLYNDAARKEHERRGNPFILPNLHFSRTANQSMAINQIRSGAIVIAGSGMCDGGRIKHHLKHNVWREDCHVVIVGFQAQGTLGRRLVDGAKHIRLWGETVRVAAQIHTIGGLSAHAGQDGLVDWYRHFDSRPPAILVHGEPGAQDTLATRLKEELQAPVFVPEHGARINLLGKLPQRTD